MKNTKQTIKQMVLAASVALTMGVASATSVPGIDAGTFSFSKPGISVGNPNGDGGGAITKINAILDAVNGTGGSLVDKSHFWNAMVDPTERNVFNYTNAKPMIEELIFTVTGEFYDLNSHTWEKATGTIKSGLLNKTSAVATIATDGTETYGSYVDGKLSATKDAAVSLMTLLGYTMSDDTSAGAHLYAKTFAKTQVDDGNGNLVDEDVDVAGLAVGGQVKTATAAAVISRTGFNNANKLIELIANELKTGFILNVDNATTTLSSIADKHTGFLSASLVKEAKKMKNMIKYLALQEAAASTGKGAAGACTGNDVNGFGQNANTAACVEVGKAFKGLIDKLPPTSENPLQDYENALASVDTFADHIISFNTTVGTFTDNPAAESQKIKDQFGTIVVVDGSSLHTALKADAEATIDAEFAAIGDSTKYLDSDLEDFDAQLDVVIVRTDEFGTETEVTETILVH